jgi:hypothetical protein
MNRFWSGLLILALCAGVVVPPAVAEEKKKEVTQAELAHLLVQVLGLSRFLPASPSDQQCFRMLMNNDISPAGGWNADKPVVRADLARVITCMMKKQGEIKNQDDPKEWVNYLKAMGIPLDAVGETASYGQPLSQPVAPHVVSAEVDPLAKRHKFNPVDETQYGVDMAYVVRVISQFEFTAGAFKPKELSGT